MKQTHLLLFLFISISCFSQAILPKLWVADKENGTYKNPILYTDYSDPDVCRVGSDFYMTASSFNCVPGLPILHSKDLVNWTLISHALPIQYPRETYDKIQHGNGVWAPSIRYHKGMFYIYWGDPDFGLYMIKSKDPKGEWSKPILIKEGKGLIDCCPFWDNNGNAYLSYAYAGSRAGLKSVLLLTRLTEDGSQTIGEGKIIFDGHEDHPTVEGTKLYKRNDFYYIFAPAGGVSTGWQLALRSRNIWGPYDEKIVMAQGDSPINGPHQGAWVDTEKDEHWFIHFQDVDTFGRVVHLQPLSWINNWPIIGSDPDGDGCGQPVLSNKKPNIAKNQPITVAATDDEFNDSNIGLQWQWHANPQPNWSYHNYRKGYFRMYSVFTDSVKNLWDIPNLFLQKFPAPEFTATTKVTFTPDKRYKGERAGFIIMGESYSMLAIENTQTGLILSQIECLRANKGVAEKKNASISFPYNINTVYLQIKVQEGGTCSFFYSFDGILYNKLGSSFFARPGKWIGAKIGYFCQRPKWSNDGGYLDIDWFRAGNRSYLYK